jgi:hypothetical protein
MVSKSFSHGYSSAHTNNAFLKNKNKNEKTISICQLCRELHYT